MNDFKFWILSYQESFAAGYSLYLKIDDRDYYIRRIPRDNLKEYKDIEIIPHSDDLKINYDQFNGYAELNERLLLELNDSFKKNQETIKAKDAEIERLKSDYYYRQYLGKQTIKDENKRIYSILEQKDKAITEAREIVNGLWAWFHIKSTRPAPNEFLEKAKAWLESNPI